jgi:cytochrome c peroxidase
LIPFDRSKRLAFGLIALVGVAGSLALAPHAAQAEDDGLPFDEKLLDSMTGLPGEIGPLPAVTAPKDNPQTARKIALGKKLYFDTRLSGNHQISCATCHDPQKGYADGLPRAHGFGGELGRHSPTVLNAAYYQSQFWDGRAADLEAQAKGPMLAPGEMHGDVAQIEKLVGTDRAYRAAFQEAFGKQGKFDEVAKAIAAYERTLVSSDSRFDRYMRGDKHALSLSEKRGLWLFVGKASCTACHSGPNFSDSQFHNLGVAAAGPLKEDDGRFAVTHQQADRGAFKTPTLRNVAETAPYMHDGFYRSLDQVVAFYNDGGGKSPHKDAKMMPLGLTKAERTDLVAFLKSLSGTIPGARH